MSGIYVPIDTVNEIVEKLDALLNEGKFRLSDGFPVGIASYTGNLIDSINRGGRNPQGELSYVDLVFGLLRAESGHDSDYSYKLATDAVGAAFEGKHAPYFSVAIYTHEVPDIRTFASSSDRQHEYAAWRALAERDIQTALRTLQSSMLDLQAKVKRMDEDDYRPSGPGRG